VTWGQVPGGCTSGEPSLAHANLQHWLDFFCSSAVTEASLGGIEPLTAKEACGFLGCMVIETGEPELDNLDVIEAGSGAGRGAMQYTGVRRTAYDRAREQAIAGGIDPNSNSWQEQYFAEEYAGLHDPPQGSLIGWTRVFEDRPPWHGSSSSGGLLDWFGCSSRGLFQARHAPHRAAPGGGPEGLATAAERHIAVAADWSLIARKEQRCKPTPSPGRPSRRSTVSGLCSRPWRW
jgi:hypothetical protein